MKKEEIIRNIEILKDIQKCLEKYEDKEYVSIEDVHNPAINGVGFLISQLNEELERHKIKKGDTIKSYEIEGIVVDNPVLIHQATVVYTHNDAMDKIDLNNNWKLK